jgi:hypothetical protein
MRDPELVARAARSRAPGICLGAVESAPGPGETPAQPVVGYVGYALKEP